VGGVRIYLRCQHHTIAPVILETPRTWGFQYACHTVADHRHSPGSLAIRSNTSHASFGIELQSILIYSRCCMQRVRLRLVAKPADSAHELPDRIYMFRA
jgi:hypothetical protein